MVQRQRRGGLRRKVTLGGVAVDSTSYAETTYSRATVGLAGPVIFVTKKERAEQGKRRPRLDRLVLSRKQTTSRACSRR